MKKLFKTVFICGVSMLLMTNPIFAKEGNAEGDETVAINLTTEASTIDFTISDEITITGTADSNDLTISSLEITNNNSIGQISVDKISVAGKNNWQIVTDEQTWKSKAKDQKEFSLVYDGNDLSQELEFSTGELLVDVDSTETLEFTGHIGVFTAPVTSTNVADMTVTLSVY